MQPSSHVLTLKIALVVTLTLFQLGSDALAQRRIETSRTIGHECLAREFLAAGQHGAAARQAAALLDSIIADVANRLPPRINSADPEQARQCFHTIEEVLAARRFYVVIPTATLMDTMLPSPAPSTGKQITKARRDAIAGAPGAPCHRMDCDTGSLIFTSIGEALNLPVVVVEAPGHKFVRWNLTGRQRINWDTNAAREYSDSDFRRGRTLTYKATMSPAEESAGKFLTGLSREDVLAYHSNIVAGILERRGQYAAAEKEYLRAMKQRKHDSLAANNLAWLYLDQPTLRTPANVRTALELAERAVAILPRTRDYLDTLARAYAANGQFENAIAAETRGYHNRSRIRQYRERKAH
jgi:tetratricopeptide (TPR) repeat protein